MKDYIRKNISREKRLVFHHLFRYFNLLTFSPSPSKKIILYGSGRSGSTLLTSLFRSHPDIYFDGEIFASKTAPNIWFPFFYLKALSIRATKKSCPYYGAGLMSTQLNGQKFLQQEKFLNKLHQAGWQFVHIRRNNILKIVLSLLRAKQDQEWISKAVNNSKIHFNCKEVIDLIKHIVGLYEIEDRMMSLIPNVKVVYETDLENGDFQELMNRLFCYLDIPLVAVRTDLIKKTKGSLDDLVENSEELKNLLRQNNYDNYIF